MSGATLAGRQSAGTNSTSHFQPEIQGLRAVAVLAVVWAHAQFPGLPGGFVGVDIFFVISGFLITRLLLAELASTGQIRLLEFWARRARRLLPNAYAALAGTLLLAIVVFPGYDPTMLSLDVRFAALELANFHFADRAVDYFSADGAASPVLHFWSLSVEEQFYVALPLLLIGLAALFRRNLHGPVIGLFILICLGSFIACAILTYIDQPSAYFGTGTRAWQLGAGALLAAGWRTVEKVPRRFRMAAAWLGAIGIVAAVSLLHGFLYPGIWALLPTLSTVALLAGVGLTPANGAIRRVLNAPAMQWIGARSYSWYLWHWPLLTLPRIAYPDATFIGAVAVPASLFVAMAAYRWIEQPVRDGRVLPLSSPWPTFASALAGLLLVSGVGAAAWSLLSLTHPATAERMMAIRLARADLPKPAKDGCHLNRRVLEQPPCLFGDVFGQRRAVLFGDSHAFHWFEPIDVAARTLGWQLRSWTKSACPSADVSINYEGFYTLCDEWREATLRRLTGSEHPDLVILSNNTHEISRVVDRSTGKELDAAEKERVWSEGFRRTIERLLSAGVQVAVIRNTPHADERLRVCLLAGRTDCKISRERALQGSNADEVVARSFGNRIAYLDFTDRICSPRHCEAVQNGIIVFRDTHHLTASYAFTHGAAMTEFLARVEEKLAGLPGVAKLLPVDLRSTGPKP